MTWFSKLVVRIICKENPVRKLILQEYELQIQNVYGHLFWLLHNRCVEFQVK